MRYDNGSGILKELGRCNNSCAEDELCVLGNCIPDCGALAYCGGTECVDLLTSCRESGETFDTVLMLSKGLGIAGSSLCVSPHSAPRLGWIWDLHAVRCH